MMPADDSRRFENLRLDDTSLDERTPVFTEFLSGPYRDRTDDIHGVNVALYQLS
jgi:hypothetical protein